MERDKSPDREAAAALAEALGNLPLALEQAAAYATQTGLSLADYLELFKARRPDVAARATGEEEYPPALATTFDISFDGLQTESPAAAELLTLCAFLAPDEVPLDILKDGAAHLPPALAAAAQNPEILTALAATLQHYALAKVRGGSFLTFHHFVQAAARDHLSEDERRSWAGTAVRLMAAAFPFKNKEPQTWEESERLLQHALTASERARKIRTAEDSAAELLNSVGRYLKNKAELVKAKAALELALELDEMTFGPNHTKVASRLNDLGTIFQDLGDLEAARANHERALIIDEAAYGPDHPDVAIDLNNLGGVLREQGDFDGARANYERALDIDMKNYGPDHPAIAIRLSNLGGILRLQGDLAGARANYERALIIDEAAYKPDHPDVAIDLNNLGVILQSLGDLEGARVNFERALLIDETTYGPGHPSVAIDLNNLSSILRQQGDVDEARANYERSLRILREVLGEKHPSTLAVKRNLERLARKE